MFNICSLSKVRAHKVALKQSFWCAGPYTTMTELHSFLDSAIADIRSRLEQEYQRRLEAHEAAIGEDLSPADFTPYYGRTLVNVELLRTLNLYSHHERDKFHRTLPSIIPAERWAVHVLRHITHPAPNPTSNENGILMILDNHGEWHSHKYIRQHEVGENKFYFYDLPGPITSQPYRMPDVLIDFCKTLKEPMDVAPLVEHYHKQFVITKPLFASGKLAEYAAFQKEKAAVEKELEQTRTALTVRTKRYEELCGMICLSFGTFQKEKYFPPEYLSALGANYDKRPQEIDAIRDLCCDDKLVAPEINCVHRACCVIEELTTCKEKQHVQMKELREIIIANEQQIRDLKKKSADIQTQLSTTNHEMAAVTEQMKQLREENQRYVDMAFQQRQEIIRYKKELLRLDPATTME
jgi:hypothetical protein